MGMTTRCRFRPANMMGKTGSHGRLMAGWSIFREPAANARYGSPTPTDLRKGNLHSTAAGKADSMFRPTDATLYLLQGGLTSAIFGGWISAGAMKCNCRGDG